MEVEPVVVKRHECRHYIYKMIKRNGILYFENLSQFPELVHGFSTREFGSMRAMGMPESLKNFAGVLFDSNVKIPPTSFQVKGEYPEIVRMKQVHSSNVVWVTEAALRLDDTDGVLTSEKDLFLSVITADCVPVLLYDPKKKYVGAVHAGWRGVYKEIVKKAVAEMIEKGSDPIDIVAGIGPCIRSCCYDIAQEHAEMFAAKFSELNNCLVKREGKTFLDLPKLVQYQLQSAGIPVTNMEDAEICTFDSEDLYSYRKEGEGFGEFVGMIGIKR